MSKITDYQAATRFDVNDVLLKDGTNGTKKILAKDAAVDFLGLVHPKYQRSVLRKKNLGTNVTEAMLAAINSGTFDDMHPGDYFTVNNHSYTILDINTYKSRYDILTAEGSAAVDKNHLVMAPTSNIGNAKMNDTNTTEGAYVGSKMYTDYLSEARTQIETDFGSMLLTHRECFSTAVTDGIPSAHEWMDSKVDLMNEVMVYGHYAHSPSPAGVINHDHYTIGREQLALFQLDPTWIGLNTFWLRDVVSASDFAYVRFYGYSGNGSASTAAGVRPYFLIGAA